MAWRRWGVENDDATGEALGTLQKRSGIVFFRRMHM
jgi:hypothetical protein